jgi:hypothetical protein
VSPTPRSAVVYSGPLKVYLCLPLLLHIRTSYSVQAVTSGSKSGTFVTTDVGSLFLWLRNHTACCDPRLIHSYCVANIAGSELSSPQQPQQLFYDLQLLELRVETKVSPGVLSPPSPIFPGRSFPGRRRPLPVDWNPWNTTDDTRTDIYKVELVLTRDRSVHVHPSSLRLREQGSHTRPCRIFRISCRPPSRHIHRSISPYIHKLVSTVSSP